MHGCAVPAEVSLHAFAFTIKTCRGLHNMFDNPAFDNHEAVHLFADESSGLRAIVAIHSTTLGPAFGGCRTWTYESTDSALTDALRLSKGMSLKNALAGLPFGGGKAVLLRPPAMEKRAQAFEALGRVIEKLGGHYVTAEDVGTTVADMQDVARHTLHVSGLGDPAQRAGGDPAPHTAYGVFLALEEAWHFVTRTRSLEGVRVAIQGIGGVGFELARLLFVAGAQLLVADTKPERVRLARKKFGATVLAPEEILSADADILAPCGLGGVLDADSIEQLRVRVICGAANNQLATRQDGGRLQRRGVLYAPDYVVNAGGIISAALEYMRAGSVADVRARILRIPETLREILERAAAEGVPTSAVADHLAYERIEQGRGRGAPSFTQASRVSQGGAS
jgi:leucine dehydrogenase